MLYVGHYICMLFLIVCFLSCLSCQEEAGYYWSKLQLVFSKHLMFP